MVESWTNNCVVASESRTRLRSSLELRSRKEATKFRLRKAFLSIKNRGHSLVQIEEVWDTGVKRGPRRIRGLNKDTKNLILLQYSSIVVI